MTDFASPSQGTDTQPFEPVAPEPVTEPVVPAGVRSGSTTTSPRPRGGRWINIALALAVVIAIGGIGFAAGRMTAPATLTAANGAGGNGFRNGQFPGNGQFGNGYFPGGVAGNDGGGFRGLFGNGGVSLQGTVESVSGDTLTLKLANGQTIQVSLTGTTTYHSQSTASAGDVKTGGTVIVRVTIDRGQGTTGTTSATDVTIVP